MTVATNGIAQSIVCGECMGEVGEIDLKCPWCGAIFGENNADDGARIIRLVESFERYTYCPVCRELVVIRIPVNIFGINIESFPFIIRIAHSYHLFYISIDSGGWILDTFREYVHDDPPIVDEDSPPPTRTVLTVTFRIIDGVDIREIHWKNEKGEKFITWERVEYEEDG